MGEVTEVPVEGRLIISNGIALQQCALAGTGLALLPQWLIGAELRSGSLVNLFPDYEVAATDFNTAVWLLYPSRAHVPVTLRVFTDFLKQEFKDRPP